MHSKILQLSESPIAKEEWVEESRFYDGFSGWIADYVAGVDDDIRNIVIEDWLSCFKENLKDWVTVDKNSITFKEGFRDYYSYKILDEVKRIAKEATANSIRTGNLKSALEVLLGDPYGFYIYLEGYGLIKEAVFLTQYIQEDTPYFFGGVIDYHY